MTDSPPPNPACVQANWSGEDFCIAVGGNWQLRAPRPEAAEAWKETGERTPAQLIISADGLGHWDSSLVMFVMELRNRAVQQQLPFVLRDLPPAIREWIKRFDESDKTGYQEATPDPFPITRRVGVWTSARIGQGYDMLGFLGESLLGLSRVMIHPGQLRWSECIAQMRRCGAQALGIVGLITFLVGVILAFVAATQLQQFGADIFVANLVGLAIFREMGPMMAAIVLTGRTGAAYAAELGNMRLNEEIDALETFGVRSHDFLVLPRMAALVVMMPLLALYANFLGIGGGMAIAQLVLDVPPVSFYAQLKTAVGLHDIGTGLLKSCFFGFIVAYSGCLKGMRATRSAAGVGEATTEAVVLGILLIIITDAGFTVLFNILRW